MNKNELPYIEPRFKTFNYLGINGVVANNYKDIENWYFNNCIQWQCSLNSDNNLNLSITSLSPHTTMDMIEKIFFDECVETVYFDDVVHSLIDNKYYINLWGIDDFYIYDSLNYKERHFYHDGMILGYDDKRDEYLYASYSKRKQFEKYFTSKTGVRKGISSTYITNGASFCGIKVKENYKSTELDLNIIRKGINEYLYPDSDSNCSYGIDVYKEIINYVESIWKINTILDIRIFRMIKEHKKCMIDRINSLSKIEIKYSEIYEEYRIIYQISSILHNLCMKYNLTFNTDILFSIVENIKRILSKEHMLLKI